MEDKNIELIEYTFVRNDNRTRIPPKRRLSLAAILAVFQIFFIGAFWYYTKTMDYATFQKDAKNDIGRLYSSKKKIYLLKVSIGLRLLCFFFVSKCSWMFIA